MGIDSNFQPKPLVKKRTLFSVLPQHMLLSQLDAGILAEPNDRITLQKLWEGASVVYNSSSNPARSFVSKEDIVPVNVDSGILEEILSQVKLYPPYDSHPTSICKARISKLVTPQIAVNIQRSELRATFHEGMPDSELLEMAFHPSKSPEPITRQFLGIHPNGSGGLLFTSYNEDFAVHIPPRYHNLPLNEKDQKSQVFENVCFPVGGRPPFVAAYLVPLGQGIHRLILANGIHRIYQMASLGYEWCPLAIVNFTPIEIGDPFVDMPRALLLDPNANPPIMTDFLNDSVVIPLNYYTTLRTVHLNWNISQSLTVVK